MAKPLPDSPQRPARRRRNRRLAHSRRPLSGPSSGLLSLLATIAASSSTVDGTPLIGQRSPPQFLCPSLQFEGDIPPDAVLIYRPRDSTQGTPDLSKRNIPDKYTQGPDGRWRKAEYILDGTTICPLLGVAPTPSVDEASSPAPYSPQPTTSSNRFIDTLPNGWKPTHKPANAHTTLILGLSLGLALFICFLITGCIFWRKNKGRRKDEEETVQKRRDELRDDQENLVEKARVNQKIWARATARWKSHARYSAQQRRGKRTGHRSVLAHSSSVSFSDPLTLSEDHDPTRPSSPYPPVLIREAPVQPWVPSPHSKCSSSLPQTSTPQNLLPHSPPAYHSRGAQVPSIIADPSQTNPSDPSLPASYCFGRSSPSMTGHTHPRSSYSSDRLPYVPPYEGAHVAVDDKGLLARMADLASAPPIEEGSGAMDLLNAQVSVPEWHDEELNDFGETSQRNSMEPFMSIYRSHPSALPFPPPPPFKGKMALYDYPHPFENLASEYEPPLEGGLPSAPPLEDTDVLPSAPPLSDTEHEGDCEHSDLSPVQNGTPPCYYP